MEKHHHHHHRRELHLLPISAPPPPPDQPSTTRIPSKSPQPPSLDLQLSISLCPFKRPPPPPPKDPAASSRHVEMLRWQAAEHRRLAAMERAYAERVRELTRREMEMAQSELARSRIMWEKTREEVARVERIKENAIIRLPHLHQQVGSSTCMEITCHSCGTRFRP